MDQFVLKSEYKPTGDQPQAIEKLVQGFEEGNQCQTLLGVTGSGKTFTMANIIEKLNKPTLVIAHNKTLAAQLYGEFKEFFPDNAVKYFVSQNGIGKKVVLFRVVQYRKIPIFRTKWAKTDQTILGDTDGICDFYS